MSSVAPGIGAIHKPWQLIEQPTPEITEELKSVCLRFGRRTGFADHIGTLMLYASPRTPVGSSPQEILWVSAITRLNARHHCIQTNDFADPHTAIDFLKNAQEAGIACVILDPNIDLGVTAIASKQTDIPIIAASVIQATGVLSCAAAIDFVLGKKAA